MALALQWGLEDTSYRSMQVLRGIIRAASTDNIQTSAIIACEGFGVTLFVCSQTINRIEHNVCTAPDPAVVGFLKGLVGYSAGDCVAQLGNSQEGQKFLALACTLVTMEVSKAARCLHSMVQNTASDKSLVPTLRHVTDLLKAIHGRCNQSGFSNEVVGCELMLREYLKDDLLVYAGVPRWLVQARYYPTVEAVEKLVDGLRLLYRLGPDDVTKMVIRTGAPAPWFIAFIKWFTGTLPSISTSDGRVLLHQEESKVEVFIPKSLAGETFDISLQSSVSGLATLVRGSTQKDEQYYGMVNLPIYGRLFLRSFVLHDELSQTAIHHALPYAFRQVLDRIVVLPDGLNDWKNSLQTMGSFRLSEKSQDLRCLRLSPFPKDHVIGAVCADVLGFQGMDKLKNLPDEVSTVFELRPMRVLIRKIMDNCRCADCSNSNGRGQFCQKIDFIESFCDLVSIILSLSLFDNPQDLLISTRTMSMRKKNGTSFLYTVQQILLGKDGMHDGMFDGCTITAILKAALSLVGHQNFRNDRPWVMTCELGQAVWPAIYDTFLFERHGFLRLFWLRGNLIYRGDTYTKVYGPDSGWSPQNFGYQVVNFPGEPVSEPRNLFPGVGLGWTVSARDGWVEALLQVKDPTGKFSSVTSCPANVLASLAEALFVERCRHKPDEKLSNPDPFSEFSGPFWRIQSYGDESIQQDYRLLNSKYPIQRLNETKFQARPGNSTQDIDDDGVFESTNTSQELLTNILATADDNELRILALSKNHYHLRLVIRGSACLECCLAVCTESGYGALVL